VRSRAGAAAILTVVLLSGCGAADRDVAQFVRHPRGRFALTHAALIDGTGAPPRENQTIVIDGDRIAAVGPSDQTLPPPGATEIDLSGKTVIPGLVGMHDHLFYAVDGGAQYALVARDFARLYLAAGVTTIRTAGAFDLQGDVTIARAIEAGSEIGPTIHPTSPYFDATGDISRAVGRVGEYARLGATSIKAYTSIGRDELAAVIAAAHARGLKVAGHLCAVGFREAVSLGIDSLEHGLIEDREFYSRKVGNQCPESGPAVAELLRMPVDGELIQDLIRLLVERGVAITSTLAVFETFGNRNAFFDARAHAVLSGSVASRYLDEIEARQSPSAARGLFDALLRREMAFELAFARAGGLLMSGADPTGWGGVVAGFGDNRNLELLVEAGFTVPEAVRIATANGARFLNQVDRIGTVAAGRQADLVVLDGHLAKTVRAIRHVDVVFKGGVGFDSAKILASEHGAIGSPALSLAFWLRPPMLMRVLIGPLVVLVLVAVRYGRAALRRASRA
jgi:imidazolonepropionase-like amidohydrolase